MPQTKELETNVEFLTRLMDFSRSGALMQGYVLEAVRIYSEQVLAMPQDQRDKMDKGFIPYEAWERCAKEALAELASHYGK